jgi:hypothetical protein
MNDAERKRFRPRYVVGAVLATLGGLFLVGVPFVPISAILADPGMIPMPERLVAFWVIGVGVLLMIPLPWRRTGEGGR